MRRVAAFAPGAPADGLDPSSGARPSATAHAVSVGSPSFIAAHRRARPVRHAAAARRRRAHRRSRRPRRAGRRECGRLGALGAARALTSGPPRARARSRAAALRLRGASSSSRDPWIAEFASTPRARATARASATLAATVAEHSPTGGPMQLVDTRSHDRHPQVEPIDEGAGDAADIAVPRGFAARACARRATLAARAGVHRGDEQHLRRERDARLCASSPARRPLRAADGGRRARAR